ncbi:MAG: hypothetical protein WHT45_12310, partial [Ignavibacterium sp.]
MKILIGLLIFFTSVCEIIAQPMSGNYTIGGNNPDFATLQQAADALNARGVSGPVFFNIRPGTYSKNGGNNTVLLLDSTVAGLSETNRVTFQPDAATGGNVDNVILERNVSNQTTADSRLVLVSLDYITFQNLTFRENDSSLYVFNDILVDLQINSFNPLVEGVVIDGCKFIGTNTSGTANGIYISHSIKDISIRNNTFIRLANGVITHSNFNSSGNLIIEDNRFLAGWHTFSGAGDPVGSAIQVNYQNIFIRRNIIDFAGSTTGGYRGIYVGVLNGMQQIRVEQNLVVGNVHSALQIQSLGGGQADSILVVNNIIDVTSNPLVTNAGGFGIYVSANNSKIVFNTMTIYGGGFSGLGFYGDDMKVFNNIFIMKPSYGFSIGYDQGAASQAINLQSNYNVIFSQLTGSGTLIHFRADGSFYFSLNDYQNATGLDTNSVSKDIEFVGPDDLHLTECQAQDPDLRGIPIAGITIDFDEEIRNATSPMMGADENDVRSNDMFGDPYIYSLPGTAFTIANAKFDNLLADGLAIPDFDNNRVHLFHYNGNRIFTPSGTLQTLWPPTVVKFFDLDDDSKEDLIVGFYANYLQIFWGDGIGGFPSTTILNTPGHVRSIEIGNDNFFQEPQVFLTIDDGGFPPNISFMAYIADDNGRENVEIVLIKKPGTNIPDTINSILRDMAIGNIDDEPNDEIVALTIGIPSPVYIFNDTTISGIRYPYSTNYRYA